MKLLGKDVNVPADRLNKLTSNQRAAILGGTMLLMVAVFVSLFFLPQRQKLTRLQMEMKTTTRELAEVKATVAGLDAFKKEIWETEIEFKKALALLPNNKEIPGLLSSISQAGSQSGLEFVLFKPKAEVPKQFYAEIPVEVKVTGGYHDVANFFDQVSKLPRIVNISDVKMKDPKETGTGQYVVSAECLATTYKFLETPPAAKEAKKPNAPKQQPKKASARS
jgi:type IV pilus assembly protein PilO